MNKRLKSALSSAILIAGLSSSVGTMAALTAAQQQQLDAINGLLKENPDVTEGLHQSLVSFVEQEQRFDRLLKDNHDYLFNNPDHVQKGSDNAKLVLINFTDFNCPWCKKLDKELDKLVEENPKVKYVNIYVPLKELNSSSVAINSSEYAMNVWKNCPEKYAKVHELLMKNPVITPKLLSCRWPK